MGEAIRCQAGGAGDAVLARTRLTGPDAALQCVSGLSASGSELSQVCVAEVSPEAELWLSRGSAALLSVSPALLPASQPDAASSHGD